jgi:prevent-host-death family protein
MPRPASTRKKQMHAPIALLKARLSEYLESVKAGEEIVVTEHGRPIARLVPIPASARGDARMQELVRAGLARPPIAPLPADFWGLPRPADPEGRTLSYLLEERRTGR